MKKNLLKLLCIFFGLIISLVISFCFPDKLDQINLFVLSLTFAILVLYAFDTHRIANQTVESNIRPIVFRKGTNLNWKFRSIDKNSKTPSDGALIEITNLKNVAVEIEGYLTKDQKKYPLYFCVEDGLELKVLSSKKWQWLPSDGKVLAVYDVNDYKAVNSKNELSILYKDIEGNSYETIENQEYIQKIVRL